jgi:hypothetical protein
VTDYAVNPTTGDVVQYDGHAWNPVDKTHVAKNAAGEVRVFDGAAWKPIKTNSPLAADKIQAQTMDEAAAYNPTGAQRIEDTAIAKHKGVKAPELPENASMWARAVDWVNGFNGATDTAAHGMTGGLTDEAGGLGQGVGAALKAGDPSAFAPGFKSGMDAVNASLAAYRERNPLLASTLEGGGLVTSPLMRVGEGWQAAGLTPSSRAVRSAATGAAKGAATGAAMAEGDLVDRGRAAALGGAAGGALGLALPLATEGTAKATQTFSEAVANKKAASQAPSVAAIKAAANAEYKSASAADAILNADPVKRLQASVQGDLANFGYHPDLQPKIGVVLKELDRVGQGNVTADGVDTIRKMALGISRSNDPSERALGGMIVRKIDDMMENLQPADIVQGNANQAVESLGKARDLWKTMRKAELLENLMDQGELQGMSTNSGGNVQNLIRQKLRTSVLENKDNARMFTPDELKTVRQIVSGTKTQNVLRQLGRLAPSSNAWLGIVSTFAAPGVGVAVPMVGAGAKALATRSTKKAIDKLATSVKQGAYRSAPQLSPAPTFPLQLRQQMINQQIRERLGLAANPAAAAIGGTIGSNY